MSIATAGALHHTHHVKTKINELVEHLRADVGKIDDPKGQALFETCAEVLLGLRKALEDYESGTEPGWK